MNRIKHFWDLKSCTSYQAHWVDQFAPGITTGGGYFKWIVGNNASITDVPGVRIKPTGTTSGYWMRDIEDGLSAEWFGPTHANQTIASLGISQASADTYWGSGTTTVASDTPDRAALNTMFDAAYTLGVHKLRLNGQTYYVNNTITIDKYFDPGPAVYNKFSLDINGGGSRILTTNNNTYSILKSTLPTDQGEASRMVGTRFVIDNLFILGQSNQTGIDLGPSSNSHLNNIEVEGASIGIRLRFCLKARITGFQYISLGVSDIGIQLESGENAYTAALYWASATTSNSQCNHTAILNCAFYTDVIGTSNIAIDIRDASGVEVVDCVIEGKRWAKGISLYSQLTTVYTFKCKNSHYECVNGTLVAGNNQAFFYSRTRAGTFEIDAPYGQYPAVMADTGLSIGGASINLTIKNVHYWVLDTNNDGFYNNGNTSYVFAYNDNQLVSKALAEASVAGTAVTECGCPGCGCGNNKYSYIGIPR